MCGDFVHVNLGKPYELFIDKVIKQGYASSQTEVLRQALMHYKDKLNIEEYVMTPEEEKLVSKKIKKELKEIKANNEKWYTLKELQKELGLENVKI